jgi:zinc protease
MSWTPGVCIDFVNTKVYEYDHSGNGLKVLLCPVPESKVCGYMRVVHAGSKEEADFSPKGMAHFLEHMSFRINGGKIWSLAKKGDVINAMTNMDSTRYYVVHLPEQTPEVIKIDANRFQQTSVPADKIPVESHAVINELERGEQAGNKMFQETSSNAMRVHPYRDSTIGNRTGVTHSTAEDMRRYRERYYVPNNATLVFAGHFDATRVLELVDKHFGSMTPGEHCHPVHAPEPPQMGRKMIELNIDAPCPMICMAFRQPKGATKEAMALKCISKLTWHNNDGRAKHLIQDNVLHDVGTYAPRQIDPYLWFMHGTHETTSPQTRIDTQSKMLAVLQSFASHKVTHDELRTVKINMKDEWDRGLESVTDMMNELGRGAATGNWKDFADRKMTLDEITPDDIQRVAFDVFRDTQMTVTHVIPTKKVAKPIAVTNMSQAKTSVAPSPSALPKPAAAQSWDIVKISPTTHVLHVPKASYVRTTLSARFSPEDHDIATIVTASMGKGVLPSGKTITSELMSLHTERYFTHDHEFVHMSMVMPNGNGLEKASNIMFEKEWYEPSFSSEVVELQKHHHIAELHSLKNDQNFQSRKHFIQALFERTKYHMPIDVRADHVAKLNVQDVRDFHAKWIKSSSNTYVTMVTPTLESASTLGKVFPSHEDEPQTTLEWKAKPREASEQNIQMPGYGSFQIMIGQTISAVPLTKEFVALKCAASVLGGGMTGRLMHTVREQRGLGTYGIYSMIQTVTPKSPAIFCIQGTFSPDSIDQGLECTKQLVQEWVEHGITPAELKDVKTHLRGSKTIALDTVDNLHSVALKNILEKKDTLTSFNKFKTILNDLSLEDVNQALRKHIDPTTFAMVKVGPP